MILWRVQSVTYNKSINYYLTIATMEALQFDAQTKMLAVINTEIPKIKKDNEVLVKVAYAGICGTDLHIIQVCIYFYYLVLHEFWVG